MLILLVGCDSPTESESDSYDMNNYFEGRWNKIHENVQVIEVESDVVNITSELLVDSTNVSFEELWHFQSYDSLGYEFEDEYEDYTFIEYPFPYEGNPDNINLFFTDMNISNGVEESLESMYFSYFLRPNTVYPDNQFDENLFQAPPWGYHFETFHYNNSPCFFWTSKFEFYKINENTSKVLIERTLRYKEEYIDEELNNIYNETIINNNKYICNCLVDNPSMFVQCSYDEFIYDDTFECENNDVLPALYPKTRRIAHEIILERKDD